MGKSNHHWLLPLLACLLIGFGSSDSSAAPSLEERLERLEREQEAMKEELEEKDARIRELEQEQESESHVPEGALGEPEDTGVSEAETVDPGEAAAADATAQEGSADAATAETETAAEGKVAEDRDPDQLEVFDTSGDISGGKGYKVATTPYGELSIGAYALLRYINQLPANQNFTDSLGVEHEVDTRQDFNLHRVLINFMGWAYDPRVQYALAIWTVNATEQVRVVGNLGMRFNEHVNVAGGIGGTPGSRSMLGSHPLWLGHDRVMADEYFRPGFTAGVWADGMIVPSLHYKVMIGNNISQLGVGANELTRDLAYSGTLWWMPTTGEFGPKGAFGDWEQHQKLATRFGISGTYSQEDRAAQINQRGPDTTQIRVGDSLLLFETDALAPGVTVQRAEYKLLAADAAIKYKGFFLMGEYYFRTLDNFHTTGPVPVKDILDHGFYVQAAFFPVPKVLETYVSTSWIFADDSAGYNTSNEYVVGANLFPFNTRNARFNLQANFVEDSPVSSSFGYYQGGLDGVVLTAAMSVYY